jgi:hypothetical protein
MVVPSIGIVIHDDDGSVLPFRPGLEKVDRVYYEGLLIERIGVAGVTILVG